MNGMYELEMLTVNNTGQALKVAMNDNYAIIGTLLNSDKYPYNGAVYIFIKSFDDVTGQESWIYNQTIYATDATENSYFGESVGIYDNLIIVGAYESGRVYIFSNENSVNME